MSFAAGIFSLCGLSHYKTLFELMLIQVQLLEIWSTHCTSIIDLKKYLFHWNSFKKISKEKFLHITRHMN